MPYAAVFVAFVVYPVGYGLWMAREPALYGELFADPRYVTTAINTLLYVGFGAFACLRRLLTPTYTGTFAPGMRSAPGMTMSASSTTATAPISMSA